MILIPNSKMPLVDYETSKTCGFDFIFFKKKDFFVTENVFKRHFSVINKISAEYICIFFVSIAVWNY